MLTEVLTQCLKIFRGISNSIWRQIYKLKMRDYTSNTYCDFLWISDILGLKKDASHKFFMKCQKNQKLSKFNISQVAIFGTIVEIKQVGFKEFLYHVDDGTGVITCKHTEEQFESLIGVIENEQIDVLNKTLQIQLEQSLITDTSADDSIFNDRSLQLEEVNINKKNRMRGLQGIWDDISKSFHYLIEPYSVGDSVIIQGKLYTYFKANQIYVNSIRLIDLSEEIIMLTIKLEDTCEHDKMKIEKENVQVDVEKRISGLMTFDSITCLSSKLSIPRNIQLPEFNFDVSNSTPEIVNPKSETTITFDTFTSRK